MAVEAASALGCDLATEVVGTFGGTCLRVSGISMVPAIRPGDLISVERARVEEISSGEIVVFKREGRLVAHRVVARTGIPSESYLVTRGDRTRRNDALVSSAELVGRITRIERGGFRVRLASRLNIVQRTISHLLRFSDRATYLYLRLASYRMLFEMRDCNDRPGNR
jgi:signal peptidase